MTSIIITYHNEAPGFLHECLEQIRTTIDIEDYEIIVVDDCSDTPLLPIEGVTVLRNSENLGVGRSFDVGVMEARGENLIIMACDIRFIANNWASRLIQEIEDHPKAITCTCCVGLNTRSKCCGTDFSDGVCQNPECKNFGKPTVDNMDFTRRMRIARNYGATILVFHDHISNPAKQKGFRSIIEAKWQKVENREQSYEIPCILGAIYGVKRDWYCYIDGFFGHRQWGTLEPYISLKSWLFGGSCRIAPQIEIGHIFKRKVTHHRTQRNIWHNKILTASLLIENPERYIDFIPRTRSKLDAIKDIMSNSLVPVKRQEYKEKTVLAFEEFCNKFKIDLRNENTDGL